jgi:hypothetical protein
MRTGWRRTVKRLCGVISGEDLDMDASADQLLNNFAIRSFRDVADDDYIAARMACRAQLAVQYLWASQQAVEKYLKCILLLHRIPAGRSMRHVLSAGLAAIDKSGKLSLGVTKPTEEFVDYLDRYGVFRYLEVSHYAFGNDLLKLDRTVWELRRFCTLATGPRQAILCDGVPAPKVRIPGGRLEKIIGTPNHPAREPLLWQNCFCGERVRRRVKMTNWFKASNAPLYLNPQMLDEVLKYVFLPDKLVTAYRNQPKP